MNGKMNGKWMCASACFEAIPANHCNRIGYVHKTDQSLVNSRSCRPEVTNAHAIEEAECAATLDDKISESEFLRCMAAKFGSTKKGGL